MENPTFSLSLSLSLSLASARSVLVAEWGVYFYNMTIGGEGELALNCI
jgi:hypothetical protein